MKKFCNSSNSNNDKVVESCSALLQIDLVHSRQLVAFNDCTATPDSENKSFYDNTLN